MRQSLCLFVVLVLSVPVTYAIDPHETKKDMPLMQEKSNFADANSTKHALDCLIKRGMDEREARHMIENALEDGTSPADIDRVAMAIADTCDKSGYVENIAAVAEVCLKAGMPAADCGCVMHATEYALGKNISPKQIYSFVQEMIGAIDRIDGEGLEAAICFFADTVDGGKSIADAQWQMRQAMYASFQKEGLRGISLRNRLYEQMKLHQ